jgi:hypothetical protein
MRFKKGDRVQHRIDSHVGTITDLRERGVAGCAVTYLEWVEVTYDNGMITKGVPNSFKLVGDE